MTEKLKQIIKEEILTLSKEAQEAINAFDWVKVTEEIGKKFLLSDVNITNFQAETLFLLVGLEEPNSYAQNIENNLGLNKNDAEKMANEAFEKIFNPIKNIMEEKVQNNIKNKDTSWEQSVDFILSGGDYSVFMGPNKALASSDKEHRKTDKILGTSNILEVKDRLIN